VEDSKPIRRENESALYHAGYEVICAEDGEAALQLAEEQMPDLILLDMILPKISGPEVLQHLKSEPATAEIPVVVLSSLSEKNREKLLEAGAYEYLEKNLLMPEKSVKLLPKVLEKVISRRRHIAFLRVPASHGRNRSATENVADVLPLKDWRLPATTAPTGTPRTSCSPTARTVRTLPESSATAAR
jgi:CheY-like chemotaxis protein